MTEVEAFADETARLAAAAARLETLERRHRVLATGFAKVERAARREHELGRSAAGEIARLARLERRMAQGERQALAIIERLTAPLLAPAGQGPGERP